MPSDSLTVPVVVLDVDGVINADEPPIGDHRDYLVPVDGSGFQVRVSDSVGAAIKRWHESGAELRWASTWQHAANRGLARVTGLPVLPVEVNGGGADNAYKEAAARRAMGAGRPLVWIDDTYVTGAAADRLRTYGVPALLIAPRERNGLTGRDLALVDRFLSNHQPTAQGLLADDAFEPPLQPDVDWAPQADVEAWRPAQTLGDLGQLMAHYVEGDLRYRPGYGAPGLDSESGPLRRVLADINRLGLVTTGSQPGHPTEHGWTQRAWLGGIADERTAELLWFAGTRSDLIVQTWRMNGAPQGRGIPITLYEGRPVAWSGRAAGACIRPFFDAETSASTALDLAWWVDVIDPVWGRPGPLWDGVSAALSQAPWNRAGDWAAAWLPGPVAAPRG